MGVALAALLAGCHGRAATSTDRSGLPVDRAVGQSDLERFPGWHLYYPGSKVLKVIGADQTPTHPGEEPNPAFAGAILAAPATEQQLYIWYGLWLAGHGFAAAAAYPPSTQTSARAWQLHHRLQVQVGIFDPARLRADQGLATNPGPGTVVYEEVLVGYPPGLPKA